MTKAALEAAVNALLPSGLPITAAGQHRPSMQQVIDELYDAQSRGDVLAGVATVLSLAGGDHVLLIRSGGAKLVPATVFGSGGADHFKGVFASEAALTIAYPTADEGDYALVDVGTADAELWIWDDTDTQWVASGVTTIVPPWDDTTAGIVERSTAGAASESENIAVQAAAGTATGLSGSRTASEVGLKDMIIKLFNTAVTWVAKMTFTVAPRFTAATASTTLSVDASKDLISVHYADLLTKVFAVASGTNTYTAGLTPALTAYTTGQVFLIQFTNAQTSTTPTLNIDSLGAKTIVKRNTTALLSGDIAAGQVFALIYDGTNFRLMGVANNAVLESVILSALTASQFVRTDSNKSLVTVAAASQSDAITGTDDTKPITSLSLEQKRSIKLGSFSNSATGSSTIDCESKQEVTVFYNTTVTGNITIALSNDSNLQILNIIIPITGASISITTPSTTRMSRYAEVSSGDGWYQSTKILIVSSVGTADTHELSFKRASAGPTFLLRYDGPARA